ncbi:MAG: hypothetical protein K0R52_1132 [Alphaproteobacteria bacterium]|jgi:hypothetical protein|nr:hypothetical protein [Alphaproteobacteria bacterium]
MIQNIITVASICVMTSAGAAERLDNHQKEGELQVKALSLSTAQFFPKKVKLRNEFADQKGGCSPYTLTLMANSELRSGQYERACQLYERAGIDSNKSHYLDLGSYGMALLLTTPHDAEDESNWKKGARYLCKVSPLDWNVESFLMGIDNRIVEALEKGKNAKAISLVVKARRCKKDNDLWTLES